MLFLMKAIVESCVVRAMSYYTGIFMILKKQSSINMGVKVPALMVFGGIFAHYSSGPSSLDSMWVAGIMYLFLFCGSLLCLVISYLFTDEALAIGPGVILHRTVNGRQTACWEDMVNVTVETVRDSDGETRFYRLNLRDGRSWTINLLAEDMKS